MREPLSQPIKLSPSRRERKSTTDMTPDNYQILPPLNNHIYTLKLRNVGYNTVKEIYRNPYKEVTTTTINKLAAALGVPTSELIEDVSGDTPPYKEIPS